MKTSTAEANKKKTVTVWISPDSRAGTTEYVDEKTEKDVENFMQDLVVAKGRVYCG